MLTRFLPAERLPSNLFRLKLVYAGKIVCFTAVLLLATNAKTDGSEADSTELIRQLVQQLDHDSYAARESAQRQLIALGAQPETGDQTMRALQDVLAHRRLEVRMASRSLLNNIQAANVDRELQKLLLPSTVSSSIQLPGWRRYSSLAGDDQPSRELFVRLVRGSYQWLQVLERMEKNRAGVAQATVDNKLTKLLGVTFDPYKLSDDDIERWTLLFCFDSPGVAHGLPNLSSRVSMALSQNGVGPKPDSPSETLVLKRLIGAWLGHQQRAGLQRSRLKIAMRFDCQQQANNVCNQIFQDTISSPAEQAIALLCASVLNRQDLEQQLLTRIDDGRTAHVWQLIASRKKKIRTEVGDVAMALLLRHHGIDPRTVGFTDLQADPMLVYRERSLGFADETTRKKAFHAAEAALKMAH